MSTSFIHPDQFKNYKPHNCATITTGQAKRLAEYIRLQDNEAMLIYIWRFVFGIENKVIARFVSRENINGIVEAFRFMCKRHLALERPISDKGMAKALHILMRNYEIMLISSTKGICWLSGNSFDYSFTVWEALSVCCRRASDERSVDKRCHLCPLFLRQPAGGEHRGANSGM